MPAYNRKLEALAEAVSRTTGYALPSSTLYKARNPGALKATLPEQPRTPEGYRIYASFLDGWQSLLHDLARKVSGTSRSGLAPNCNLSHLAGVRNEPITAARNWSLFLRAALEDESLRPTTPLSFFSE